MAVNFLSTSLVSTFGSAQEGCERDFSGIRYVLSLQLSSVSSSPQVTNERNAPQASWETFLLKSKKRQPLNEPLDARGKPSATKARGYDTRPRSAFRELDRNNYQKTSHHDRLPKDKQP